MPPQQPDVGIPPGWTTLRLWAPRHGRTFSYVQRYWRRQLDFPHPVGELASRGRFGGGRGELLFDETALDAWLAGHPDLGRPERIDLASFGIDPEERITLGRFATLICRARKTVTQHRGRPGFPTAGDDGRYRAGELFDYWNSRTGRRGRSRPN